METSNLSVIGLCDVICHMAASPEKKGGRPCETQLHNYYVDGSLREVTGHVQRNQTLWLLPGAVASC